MDRKRLWEKSVEFHGHQCGGLTIGYKAALYAIELLELEFSVDEEVVCVSENDACGIDAIQVILGCSIGKGNLLFHMTGKQAFSFYNCNTLESVRLVLKKRTDGMSKEESFIYYQDLELRDMFDIKERKIKLPERARKFKSYICHNCGEAASSNFIRIERDEKYCIDCYDAYNRFGV